MGLKAKGSGLPASVSLTEVRKAALPPLGHSTQKCESLERGNIFAYLHNTCLLCDVILNLDREGETLKEETGSKKEGSFESLKTLYARISVTFYMLSELQHFQTFSRQDKGLHYSCSWSLW